MNKLHYSLFILLCSSLLINITNEISAKTSARKQQVKHYVTSKKLKRAWKSNVVKIGTVTAACALFYALGVQCNIIAAPALLCVTNNALQPTPQLVTEENTTTTSENSDDVNATQLPTPTDNDDQKKNNLTDGQNCLQQEEKLPNSSQTNTLQSEETIQTEATQEPVTIQCDNANTESTAVVSEQSSTTVTTTITNTVISEQAIKSAVSVMLAILENAQQDSFN